MLPPAAKPCRKSYARRRFLALRCAIATDGRPAFYEPDAAHIVDRLVPLLQQNDVVAVFSNGGFDGIHEKILDRLRAS